MPRAILGSASCGSRGNIGLAASLNRRLEHCRAALVARADADDRYPPDRLDRQLRSLAENPDLGLLSWRGQQDRRGRHLPLYHPFHVGGGQAGYANSSSTVSRILV